MSPRKQFATFVRADFCPDHTSASPRNQRNPARGNPGSPVSAYIFQVLRSSRQCELDVRETPGSSNSQIIPSPRRTHII